MTQSTVFRWSFKLVDFYLHVPLFKQFGPHSSKRKESMDGKDQSFRPISGEILAHLPVNDLGRRRERWIKGKASLSVDVVCCLSMSGCIFVYLLSCLSSTNNVEIEKV